MPKLDGEQKKELVALFKTGFNRYLHVLRKGEFERAEKEALRLNKASHKMY